MLGRGNQPLFFQKKCAARFHPDNANLCSRRHTDGFRADAGHIKSHVLAGFGDFDHHATLAGECAPAFDGFIRAFEGFDRQDRYRFGR